MQRILAGKYRLEAPLRSGAMGALYKAHHLTLDKTVCIKIMHPELAKDEQFALRFHREARAASRFDHPASILILDYGADEDGTLYIAMELVDGRDLFDLLDDGEVFTPHRIVDLMSQTLAALAAAHDVGILHRDLKPENIMVTSSVDDGERVKVCDFGIAHIEEDSSPTTRRLTRHGFILGTPEYMSPEQARGEKVDARADVYAVGCILYHLLTGRPPFEDDSAVAVALKQINEVPPKPSAIKPSVHPKLEMVCLKAMQKDPNDRYTSAREMRRALREAVSFPLSSPIPLVIPAETLPEPIVAPTVPRGKKRRWVIAAALVAMLGAGGAKLRHAPIIAAVAAAPKIDVVAALPQVVLAAPSPVIPAVKEAVPIVHDDHAAPQPVVKHVASKPPPPVVVAEPEPEPAPTPTPEPVAAPPPPPPVVVAAPAPAPTPAAPAYAIDRAHVDLGAATTMGATMTSVERAISPVKSRIDVCYRAALPHLSTLEGTGVLHIETDDVGNIRRASVTGAVQGEAGECIAHAALGRRVANVDTGLASADIPLAFHAR
jgi:serine/threonine-protein kinase